MSLSPRKLILNIAAAAFQVSGVERFLKNRRRKSRRFRVVILEYHEVSVTDEREGVVSSTRLRRHLECLQADFKITSLSEAVQCLRNRNDFRQDLAVVTFDDGCLGNYVHGRPVFEELGVSATVFVTTSFVDGQDLWFDTAKRQLSQLREARDKLPANTRDRLLELFGRWPISRDLRSEIKNLKYMKPEARADILDYLATLNTGEGPSLQPMTWEQLRELKSNRFELGCHTVTHPILSTSPK